MLLPFALGCQRRRALSLRAKKHCHRVPRDTHSFPDSSVTSPNRRSPGVGRRLYHAHRSAHSLPGLSESFPELLPVVRRIQVRTSPWKPQRAGPHVVGLCRDLNWFGFDCYCQLGSQQVGQLRPGRSGVLPRSCTDPLQYGFIQPDYRSDGHDARSQHCSSHRPVRPAARARPRAVKASQAEGNGAETGD